MFESSKKVFPSAGGAVEQYFNAAELSKPAYGYEGANWMYQILPNIEQKNLYDLRRGDGGANAGFVETSLCEFQVPLFNCPSRNNRFATVGTDIYALNDYAGVMASWNTPDWEGFEYRLNYPPVNNEQTAVWTGILVRGGHVKTSPLPAQIWKFPTVGFRNIEDGASHTILLSEKSVQAEYYTVSSAQPWPFWELYGYYTGADWPHMRQFGALIPDATNPSPEVPIRSDHDRRPNTNPIIPQPAQEFGFGSAHPGIICAVFGDGSTRNISDSASLVVLDQLGKRSDGSLPSLDQL